MKGTYTVRVSGPLACFALPFGPERTSSLIPSHDAAESILKSIYGPWEVAWEILDVRFLTRPRKLTMTLNEVHSQAISPRSRSNISYEDNRTQRTTTFLVNPDYAFRVRPTFSGRGSHPTNLAKIHETFTRRIKNGGQQTQPYLGIRECTAYVELMEEEPQPEKFDSDLGLHYYGYDFSTDTPYFYPLQIEAGVVRYPSWAEVRQSGMRGQGN